MFFFQVFQCNITLLINLQTLITEMELLNSLIANLYLVKKKLGSGAFGQIYLATNIKTSVDYAIKCESIAAKHPQLLYQAKIISHLNTDSINQNGIPKTYFCCKEKEYNVMVMDVLGLSLQDIFNKCNRKFDLKTTLMIGIQMIERIEYVHKKFYLHRDVKPDNFLMGNGKKQNIVYLIDFGLAKKYIEKNGSHISYKDNKNLTGTARYASLNTHLGIQQSRRDDLQGVANVLIYFLKGQLPWQNIKANTKKQKYEKIMEKKLITPIQDICKDLPEQIKQFLIYSRNLEFEEQPNYQYIKNLFYKILKRQNMNIDYIYCWNYN